MSEAYSDSEIYYGILVLAPSLLVAATAFAEIEKPLTTLAGSLLHLALPFSVRKTIQQLFILNALRQTDEELVKKLRCPGCLELEALIGCLRLLTGHLLRIGVPRELRDMITREIKILDGHGWSLEEQLGSFQSGESSAGKRRAASGMPEWLTKLRTTDLLSRAVDGCDACSCSGDYRKRVFPDAAEQVITSFLQRFGLTLPTSDLLGDDDTVNGGMTLTISDAFALVAAPSPILPVRPACVKEEHEYAGYTGKITIPITALAITHSCLTSFLPSQVDATLRNLCTEWRLDTTRRDLSIPSYTSEAPKGHASSFEPGWIVWSELSVDDEH